MNNHLLNYIELRRNGNLKKYLRYFPEHQHLFNNYKEKIHSLSNDLYTTYKNVFIHKTTNKNDIPYHLKPMIYQIHKNYLTNLMKSKISIGCFGWGEICYREFEATRMGTAVVYPNINYIEKRSAFRLN